MTTIEITRNDDTSVVQGRLNPFQVVGTDVSGATTAHEVMEQAHLLGWNVHLQPVQTVPVTETVLTMDGVDTKILEPALAVENTFATVRTNPFDSKLEVIGTVGNRYVPTQNEEIADYLDAFAKETGGTFSRAADFYGDGKQIFFTIDLPTSVMIGGVDQVNKHLTFFTSHDGSRSITPVIHSLRVFCANMAAQTLRSSDISTKIRHTASAGDRLSQVRAELGVVWKNMEAFDRRAELLFSKKVADAEFWGIVNQLWDPKDAGESKRGKTLASNRISALSDIWHGPTNANINGTAWAAFNCITEYLQHGHRDAATNATRALTSAVNTNKTEKAATLLLAL